MFSSLSSQIEYIVGYQWNEEYNNKRFNIDKILYHNCKCYSYHRLSKVKWMRELTKLPKSYEDWCISTHPDVTLDIIRANPTYKWNWKAISVNLNITWDIVCANPGYPWSWHCMSYSPNITWDIIQANPGYPWNWWGISWNPNITLDIIQANPDKPWDWYNISRNPNITLDIIQANPDKPWHWTTVSQNPNITWDIIQENPDKPWDWAGILKNINITWDIIATNNLDKSTKSRLLIYNTFDVQARISMAKHRLKAYRKTNYLARYIRYSLVIVSLEYGY